MTLEPVDYVIAAILALAVLRGLARGLLRETFSIASLAAATVAVRLFWPEVATWLTRVTEGQIGETAAPWAAGAAIAIGTIAVATTLGRLLRRGAKVVGLGWADRAGGAVLGTAEGLLVAGILIGLIGYVMGRNHPSIAHSRSLHAFEELEELARGGQLPEIDFQLPMVASPPPEQPEKLIANERRAIENEVSALE
ncbi:MAG: CvpA family protein [Myxococcota bacterium]|jgi:membrane protein required for colicin V production|nr:CvpA family protein [bacterium]MDP6074968.1 CvpA family protein [Myxococcota bacterium]MDP6243098.1 CvpA family protein [Myxococcota bacterium]MDP7076273.1 CvpA family protein [Myxococcota bacterium]MDP7298080.1 CvpA family protein [Myxococcota bacterium]